MSTCRCIAVISNIRKLAKKGVGHFVCSFNFALGNFLCVFFIFFLFFGDLMGFFNVFCGSFCVFIFLFYHFFLLPWKMFCFRHFSHFLIRYTSFLFLKFDPKRGSSFNILPLQSLNLYYLRLDQT